MKKLLLTSAGFKNPKVGEKFLKLVNKPVSEIKIIFIPTAARTKEELKYVDESKKELLDLGIPETNIKILNLDKSLAYEEVKDFDVIYVRGGNTFYLMHKVRETGFDGVIKQFVKEGKVYVGVSAGSIIAGPNLSIADKEQLGFGDVNNVGLKDLTGLNLTNIAIFPHFRKEEHNAIEKFKKKVNYQIVTLTDSQALLILDDKITIIGD